MSGPSWVPGSAGSGFDVDHLPYGVFSVAGQAPRVGARIGDRVVDLASLSVSYDGSSGLFDAPSLDRLLAAGAAEWARARAWLQGLLRDPGVRDRVEPHLLPVPQVDLRLPFTVADYVDFYASEHHASDVGRLFRPDAEPLPPQWRHLPVAYHGRAGTVVVSGTDVRRPWGQRRSERPGERGPVFAPTARLDLEAELGFVVGMGSTLGEPVPTHAFSDHVFGVVGLNDWSARDVQAYEYVPLGPFGGKSFATSISAWVTPLAALAEAWVDLPGQDPAPAEHLRVGPGAGLAIDVEVEVAGEVLTRPPYSSTYWAPAQMLAHLTVNGASLRTGDLLGSGTISGPQPGEQGSLLELSRGGREPFVAGGRRRTFLEDGDEVVLRYRAAGESGPLTLGEVRGRVLPALTTAPG